MVRALALFLFGTRWGWLILGVIGLAVGSYLFFTAQPLTFVQTSGTALDYTEVTHNSLYDHNELKINGDERLFILHKNDFHPDLPDKVFDGGKVIVWSDAGTGVRTVYAITLYDENDENPQQYTTDYFNHPASFQGDNQRVGGVIGGLGLLALLNGLFWPLLPRGRKRDLMPTSYQGISSTTTSLFPPDHPFHR
jgi:hypothetical protein